MSVQAPEALGSEHLSPGETGVRQAGELRSARVESLRGIGAIGVLVGHICGYAYAWGPVLYTHFSHRLVLAGGAGVYLFFTLSGYLLFWPFVRRDYLGGAAVRLRYFALNRAVRVLPLYYAVLFGFIAAGLWMGPHGQWWRFALFLENFSARTVETGDGPMWSLVVEVQFYLVLPLLAATLGVFSRGSIRRAAFMVGSLGLLSVVLHLYAVKHGAPGDLVFKDSLPSIFFLLASGMLLALLRAQWMSGRPRWLDGMLASSNAWAIAAFGLWVLFAWKAIMPASELIMVPASFLLVGACVLPLRPGRIQRWLDWRPLVLIGVASYSLYLLHVPIVHRLSHLGLIHANATGFVVLLVVAGTISCLAALVSYAVIERNFLRLRRRWAPVGRGQPANNDAASPSSGSHGEPTQRGSAHVNDRSTVQLLESNFQVWRARSVDDGPPSGR